MPFRVSDMSMSFLPVAEDDDSWIAVIGCGPQSLLFHGNTQKPYVRYDPIDIVHGVKSLDDLRALRQELRNLIARLDVIEKQRVRGEGEGEEPPAPGETALPEVK
jgi:hypothetical protein